MMSAFAGRRGSWGSVAVVALLTATAAVYAVPAADPPGFVPLGVYLSWERIGANAKVAGVEPWVDAVKQSVAKHEARGREVMAENGGKFLGAERAESVSPYDRATSSEPPRGRNPTFASGTAAGAFAGAVAALREFRAAYAAAMARWRAGLRDAVFPTGTWSMARVHSVVVAT